jgi:hypothetical protein
MLEDRLTLVQHLKQDLREFVLNAEDELAIALESYTVQELKRLSTSAFKGSDRTDFILDQFLTEGWQPPENQAAPIQPIEFYLAAHPDLKEELKSLLTLWFQAFIGLFKIEAMIEGGLQVHNALTQKPYKILFPSQDPSPISSRMKSGDIVLGRILPVSSDRWCFSGPTLHLGKLGDPKLAVAIGSFKQHHPDYLYADAPQLLEEAWISVEEAHATFTEFFKGESVTLSGEELHQKLKAYQDFLTQRELDQSGIDGSKSLKTLSTEAGITTDELDDKLALMGVDPSASKKLIESQSLSQMVKPPLELPRFLRSAPRVTVLTDPRGGQVFLPDYEVFLKLLTRVETIAEENLRPQVQAHLENLDLKPFVWRSLAATYPQALEKSLQITLKQPTFSLSQDFDALLLQYHDRLDPTLPETASVPVHLHALFQRAIEQIKPAKKKSKGKPKGGFG